MDPAEAPNVPTGHITHAPAEFTWLPAGHITQEDEPATDVEPMGHDRQLLEVLLLELGL